MSLLNVFTSIGISATEASENISLLSSALSDKCAQIRRSDYRTTLDELREMLDILEAQYSVDLFLTEDPSSFNNYAVFVRSRDLCNKVGVRILFNYDEIFYGSCEYVIRKIISAIEKMKEPIEKPVIVKPETVKLKPRLCQCCGAPMPTNSNTCEYCGVSYGEPEIFDDIVYRDLKIENEALEAELRWTEGWF